MPNNEKSRRSVLKNIAATSTLASVSSVATVGTASAQDKAIDPEDHEEPYPDVDYKSVGDDVWEAVGPQYWLLTVDRKRLGELLEMSPVSNEKGKSHEQTIDQMRSTYEVEKQRNGNELVYNLVGQSAKAAGKKQRAKFAKAAEAAFKGLSVEAQAERDDDEVVTEWYGKTHSQQIKAAAADFSMSDSKISTIADGSKKPDEFACYDCSADWLPGTGYVPDFLVNELESAIKDLNPETRQPPYHFYWPDPPSLNIWEWEIGPSSFGGAPGEAQYMMDNAADSYYSRDYIGYTAHYLQDMSVPVHTGAIWEQVNPDPQGCSWDGCDQYLDPRFELHQSYEDFVRDNFPEGNETWYLDKSFEESFNSTDYPFYFYTAEAECIDLAEYSSQYATSIFEELISSGTSPYWWDDSVYKYTHNCMSKAGGYVRGLLDEFYDFNY